MSKNYKMSKISKSQNILKNLKKPPSLKKFSESDKNIKTNSQSLEVWKNLEILKKFSKKIEKSQKSSKLKNIYLKTS